MKIEHRIDEDFFSDRSGEHRGQAAAQPLHRLRWQKLASGLGENLSDFFFFRLRKIFLIK